MARCWSKLGHQDKALDLANSLVTTVLYTSVSVWLELVSKIPRKSLLAWDFCAVTKVTDDKQMEGKTDFLQAARTLPKGVRMPKAIFKTANGECWCSLHVPQSQEASNICHLTGILLLKVSIDRAATKQQTISSVFVSLLFRRQLTSLLTVCEGLHLSGVWWHEVQDVILAAAVQPAAL